MSLPQIVSREEWLSARKELLAKEKAATRARDALNAERRGLPMVEIDKECWFRCPERRWSRPHRARPAGGLGGAEGSRGLRTRGDAGLRGLSRESQPAGSKRS
jgi:hypothetical protein